MHGLRNRPQSALVIHMKRENVTQKRHIETRNRLNMTKQERDKTTTDKNTLKNNNQHKYKVTQNDP